MFCRALVMTGLLCGVALADAAQPTVGGGTVDAPAVGPGPSFGVGEGKKFVLVKNWDFGADGTIRNIEEMNEHFQYHDQFGTFANGTKYGAWIVAPDASRAITYNGHKQPVEGVNTDRPVRELTENSIKTYVVPLDGATRVHPTEQKAGSGAFQAIWTLPNGGSRLGRDIIWETRVRYKAVPYFWFSLWVSGNKWNRGAEIDLIESFGYDNGNGYTNFEGKYWHSSPVGGTREFNYHSSWSRGMAHFGITQFDPTEWHVWTLHYRADDTFTAYVDGRKVQEGTMHWTLGTKEDGEPINMSFIFDASWGHRQVKSVNHWLDASELLKLEYEFDYSRVYLSDDAD